MSHFCFLYRNEFSNMIKILYLREFLIEDMEWGQCRGLLWLLHVYLVIWIFGLLYIDWLDVYYVIGRKYL